MAQRANTENEQQAVCGQAHAVFDILTRTESLPCNLSLSIEEILERAWEIAYRRQRATGETNVIPFPVFQCSANAQRAAAHRIASAEPSN